MRRLPGSARPARAPSAASPAPTPVAGANPSLSTDGAVSAWQRGPALPQTFGYHHSLVARGHLFVLDADTGNVLAAKLGEGTVGDWRRADGLDGPRSAFGAVFSDGVLYASGGVDVRAASVHDDGTLGSWSHVGTLRSAASSSVAAAGALVAVGAGGAELLPLRAAIWPTQGRWHSISRPSGSATCWKRWTSPASSRWA